MRFRKKQTSAFQCDVPDLGNAKYTRLRRLLRPPQQRRSKTGGRFVQKRSFGFFLFMDNVGRCWNIMDLFHVFLDLTLLHGLNKSYRTGRPAASHRSG